MIVTLFVLSLLVFYTTSFFSPQQRAFLYISPQALNHPGFDPWSKVELIIKKYHLDDPFYVQYANWVSVTLTEGTLGYSALYHELVSNVILNAFPATLELVVYSAPLIVLGGIKLGVYSAVRAHEKKRREDPVDFIVRVAISLTHSIPVFLVGMLMLSITFMSFHWLAIGRVGAGAQFFITSETWKSYTGLYTIDALLNRQYWIFLDALKHLVLPVATLTIFMLPIVVKVTRSSVLAELSKPYVTTAKAKGLQKAEVTNHAKRNAMISILTVSSMIFASMMTGIVVTESTFMLYGLGFLAVEATRRLDFTLLAGLSIFFCLIFVVLNLIVDIMYTHIDPRVNL